FCSAMYRQFVSAAGPLRERPRLGEEVQFRSIEPGKIIEHCLVKKLFDDPLPLRRHPVNYRGSKDDVLTTFKKKAREQRPLILLSATQDWCELFPRRGSVAGQVREHRIRVIRGGRKHS